MKSIQYDASKRGLEAIFKPWQTIVLDTIHGSSKGLNSRAVTEEVKKKIGENSISRASIINFLEFLRELGVLRGEDETGKGGHRWVYFPAIGKTQYKQFIVETLLTRVTDEFPAEMKTALEQID